MQIQKLGDRNTLAQTVKKNKLIHHDCSREYGKQLGGRNTAMSEKEKVDEARKEAELQMI